MKKVHIPEAHVSHPNVTPLIDIVMCLIIFFMLVAKIGVSTGAEQMDIPASILGTDIQDMGNTLTLNVRPGPLDQPHARPQVADSHPLLPALVALAGQHQVIGRGFDGVVGAGDQDLHVQPGL